MKTVCSALCARKSDNATIQSGTPSLELMFRAGKSVFDYLESHSLLKGKIAIVCGHGNNGGDGFALANLLIEKNILPTVFVFEGKLSPDSDFYKKKFCEKGGLVYTIAANTLFSEYDLIVDAIFGTGINKAVEGIYATVIERINCTFAKVVSCDIASGLDTDNGQILGSAIRADATITFASAKFGHFLGEGRDYSGELIIADIGIDILEKNSFVLEKSDMIDFFKPLKINIHKGNSGKGGIIGGSKNFIGAPYLCSMGDFALKVGSGLSYLGIPECIYNAVSERVVNNIIYPMKCKDGVIIYDEKTLQNFTQLNAIAIGMGMGDCEDLNKIIGFLIENSSAKLLLDADALNKLDSEILKTQKNRVLITPHPKEFARLIKSTTKKVLENSVKFAKNFAREYNTTVLLKGATTIITDGNRVAFNTTGTSGMAKGGSGDLLDGIILGMLTRGFEIFDSACAGAFIAGRSAELAIENGKMNDFTMLPMDRFGYINQAINEIIK